MNGDQTQKEAPTTDERLAGEPETAETAARQPEVSAARPATRSRRQIDGEALALSHTPGPWHIEDRTDSEGYWIAIPVPIGRKVIAEIDTGFDEPWDSQQHANARLIAAAPDLLALAKQYASECADCRGTGRIVNFSFGSGWGNGGPDVHEEVEGCSECEDIRAVIAKAEGRS